MICMYFDTENVHILDGNAKDLDIECKNYEDAIEGAVSYNHISLILPLSLSLSQ